MSPKLLVIPGVVPRADFRYRVGEAMTVERLCYYRGVRHLLLDSIHDALIVTVGRDENHRHAAQLAEPSSGFDAIASAIEVNVHYDDVRPLLDRERNGLSCVRRYAAEIADQGVHVRL